MDAFHAKKIRGYVEDYRSRLEFFRNICIPIAGNSNLSKNGIKCLKIVVIHSNRC